MANWAKSHMMAWSYPEDVTQTELAYLAGIVDGEGMIGMHAHTKRRKTKAGEAREYKILQPAVGVYNNNVTLIEWLQNRIGFRMNGKDRRQARTNYYVVITGYRTYNVLQPLLPYLIAKKPQALLLMEYAELRLREWEEKHNPTYSTREVEIWQALQEMNWRKFDPFVAREYPNLSTT